MAAIGLINGKIAAQAMPSDLPGLARVKAAAGAVLIAVKREVRDDPLRCGQPIEARIRFELLRASTLSQIDRSEKRE